MIKTCKIHCLSVALSPITHMMGTSGNESVINREPVLYNNDIHYVPVISGNALRHKMVREPGALHLVKICELDGKLNLDQANFLFNGGTLSESSPAENIARIAEMQELLPLIRLLGGSLRNQVICGSLLALRGVLVCEENRATLRKLLPADCTLPDERLRSAEDFIGKFQYTRGDAQKRNDAGRILDGTPADKTQLMIYSGQDVIPGAVFYHGFILQNVSELEIGALLNSLYEWDTMGATIGGSARIGHGKLQTSLWMESGDDLTGDGLIPGNLVELYRNYTYIERARIADWLNDAFASKSAAKKAAKKALDANDLLG
jgi:hypothetical protein